MAEAAGHSDFSGVMGQDVPFLPDPSQRVLVLLFYSWGDASSKARGICVVRSETLLRLAREIGEGVIGWDVWVAPDTDEVPGADPYTKYSVSGSRFVAIDTNETEEWAKIRVYDLSHWSRQHPDVGLDGDEESDGKMARCRHTERVLELPESVWNICHTAMLRDCLVLFSVGHSVPSFESRSLADALASLITSIVGGIPKHKELWMFGVSGEATH
jgi:hypothetical protein